MSAYTPTTEQVREWALHGFGDYKDLGGDWFDRWLQQVKAEAWEEGARAGLDKGLDIAELVHQGSGKLNIPDVPPPPTNPYRQKAGE